MEFYETYLNATKFSLSNGRLLKNQNMENRPKRGETEEKTKIQKKNDTSHPCGMLGASSGKFWDISRTTPGHLQDKFDNLCHFCEISPENQCFMWFFYPPCATTISESSASCFCFVFFGGHLCAIKKLPNIRPVGTSFVILSARIFTRFVFTLKCKYIFLSFKLGI